MDKLDEIDMKLISLLQSNARAPVKQLAKELFLSAPAVSARIERLEKMKVITGYTATVDYGKLGYHITAFINLKLPPGEKEVFYPFIRKCANVIECSYITGNYSMLVKAVFPSTAELDAFVGELQQFGHTQTQIVFSTPVPPRGVNAIKRENHE